MVVVGVVLVIKIKGVTVVAARVIVLEVIQIRLFFLVAGSSPAWLMRNHPSFSRQSVLRRPWQAAFIVAVTNGRVPIVGSQNPLSGIADRKVAVNRIQLKRSSPWQGRIMKRIVNNDPW